MSKEFSVRLYEEGDEEGIVELLQMAFPTWRVRPNPIDHWRWKFIDQPHGSNVRVAISENKVIGVSHDMNFMSRIGSSLLPSQFGADAVTHPDFRGLGVYKKIIELGDVFHDKLGIQFECGQSVNPAVNKSWTSRGHVAFPHDLSYMVRIRDVDLHLRKRPKKNTAILKTGYNILKGINSLRAKKNPSVSGVRIIDTIHLESSFDDFWLEASSQYGLSYEKNAAYLNWRYLDRRAGYYLVKQAVKDEEVVGFISLGLEEGDYPEGFIMELMTRPGMEDVADMLLQEACNHFDNSSVNVIYYLVVQGNPYQIKANNYGFVDSRAHANIVCNVTLKENFDLIESLPPSGVYFSYGDLF